MIDVAGADHGQAVAIISEWSTLEEYRRRHQETGDAYPWWSLQPGYPDELRYFDGPHCQQGGYANGGLMPWVGGELCRGAFEHGLESYGLELYQQYIGHLARSGDRVHVWYWPDGQAGFRTTNEVPYTGWGMAQWLHALIAGLAGLTDQSGQMQQMQVSPRWAVTEERDIRAIVRYAANDAYFAYRLRLDRERKAIHLQYTGSGREAQFHILLPHGWRPQAVSVNGQAASFRESRIEQSEYVDFASAVGGLGNVWIQC